MTQVPLAELAASQDRAALFERCLDPASGAPFLQAAEPHRPGPQRETGPREADLRVEPAPDGRGVHLKAASGYLCAQRDGTVVADRTRAGKWETFFILSEREVRALRHLLDNAWIHYEQRRLVRFGNVQFGDSFAISDGARRYPLQDNFRDFARPGAADAGCGAAAQRGAVTLFRDGWMFEKFVLYRPLIYACIFNSTLYLDCFEVCVGSAERLGGYAGDYLVLTDLPEESFARLRARLGGRLHLWRMSPGRKIDYMAARYEILRWPQVADHQPILYVDCDVAFDAPMAPWLTEVALGQRISAQVEDFSRLRRDRAVGARLFRASQSAIEDANGLNSGVIAFANHLVVDETFSQISASLYRYFARNSEVGLRHIDQPFFNFVVAKTADVDRDLLTRRIRYTSKGEIRGGPAPLGIVHFWDSGSTRNTARVMRDYVNERIAAAAAETAAAAPPAAGHPRGTVSEDGAAIVYAQDGRDIVRLHLLEDDNRAAMLRQRNGVSQPEVMQVWHRLVRASQPGLVLDIGANHGELSLTLLPAEPCSVLLFEPNPGLAEVLRRSIASHVAGERYTLIQGAASDAPGTAMFHVDRKWSGTSSLDFYSGDAGYKGGGRQQHEDLEVRVVTVDEAAAPHLRPGRPVAAKIDVEGHEPKVIRGARRTLLENEFFLVLEFSARQLALSGFDPLDFAGELMALGEVHRIDRQGGTRSVTDVQALAAGHSDVVVTNSPRILEVLGGPAAGAAEDTSAGDQADEADDAAPGPAADAAAAAPVAKGARRAP